MKKKKFDIFGILYCVSKQQILRLKLRHVLILISAKKHSRYLLLVCYSKLFDIEMYHANVMSCQIYVCLCNECIDFILNNPKHSIVIQLWVTQVAFCHPLKLVRKCVPLNQRVITHIDWLNWFYLLQSGYWYRWGRLWSCTDAMWMYPLLYSV